MVRTVYCVAASLDGFLIGRRNPADGRNPGEPAGKSGDLRFEDPSRREFPGGAGQEFPDGVGAVAMGAATYRSLLAAPESWPYGKIPVWVFTHHEFPGISGADVTFVRGDVREFHPDIVYDAGEKDVLLAGGGNLAGQFMDCGLVDDLVFTVVPVVLGGGRPMLPVTAATKPAALVGTRSAGPGLVQLHYAFGPV